MDDLSDGEGDEEAAAKARHEMEILEDKERTKAVITAVTEGRDAYKKSLRKGKYTFQKLVGDNTTMQVGDEGQGNIRTLLVSVCLLSDLKSLTLLIERLFDMDAG